MLHLAHGDEVRPGLAQPGRAGCRHVRCDVVMPDADAGVPVGSRDRSGGRCRGGDGSSLRGRLGGHRDDLAQLAPVEAAFHNLAPLEVSSSGLGRRSGHRHGRHGRRLRLHRHGCCLERRGIVVLLAAQALALPHILLLLVLRAEVIECRGERLQWLRNAAHHEHLILHVHQELLLAPEDAARPADPAPPNKGPGWEVVVLHCVHCNEGASPSEARLAVNGYRAWLLLDYLEEPGANIPGWAASINEVQVAVLDALLDEEVAIVLLAVQADDEANAQLLEDAGAVFRRERREAVDIPRG
mmetsp:Transcript_52037/g.134204  ORF Transcript_52037/g.134204 Transcript_52037/m.134204 type:complete len:299 (+) Transcript_52037:147-1043(+)